MKQIKNAGELKAAILELEKRKSIQEVVIKEQAQLAKKALNPVNVVKNTFSKLAQTPEIQRTLISTVVGLGIGYVATKATKLLSEESMDGIMNNLIDRGADHLLEKHHPESLVARGIDIARNILKEKMFAK